MVVSGLRSEGDSEARVADANESGVGGGMAEVENARALEQQGGESDRETFEEGADVLMDENEQEETDVFEDAPAGVAQQQTGLQRQEHDERGGGSISDASDRPPAGGLQIRVRAPVTDETDENDPAEDDGETSFASGESFDSALERMASISGASFDTSSPKESSPPSGPGVFGEPPVDMNPAQQGALMRLNSMIKGEASLDSSVIENSNGQRFRAFIAELAESRNQSVEDASFSSIVDALLPLVLEKSEDVQNQPEDLKLDITTPESSLVEESKEVESPMPKAKLSTEDEPYLTDEDDIDSDEQGAEQEVEETGDNKADEKAANENGDGKHEEELEVVLAEGILEGEEGVEETLESAEPEVQGTGHQELSTSAVSDPIPETPVIDEKTAEAGAESQEQGLTDKEAEVSPGVEASEEGDITTQQEVGDVDDTTDYLVVKSLPAEEPERVFAMPTAKLTTEDSDESFPSEGDSEERENGDEQGEGNENIEESNTNDDQGDEEEGGSEYHSEEDVEDQEPQDVPLKVLESPDSEVATKEISVVQETEPQPEQEELEKIIPAENGDSNKIGNPEVEDVSLEVTTEETPEPREVSAGTAGVLEPSGVEHETEAEPKQKPRDFALPVTVAESGTHDSGHQLETPNMDISNRSLVVNVPSSFSDTTYDSEQANVSVEDNPSSSPLSQRLEDVSDGSDARTEDGDIGGEWDEEIEEDEDEEAEALLESSSALAALVRAADTQGGGEADTPSLGAAGPSLPARPTRVGRSAPSSDSAASRAVPSRSSGAAASTQLSTSEDNNPASGEANDGNEETREKLQVIRVKFLRLALRLGQSAHNVVVAQVLYRLGLAEQLRGGRSSGRSGAFSFDRASAIAEEQEAAGPEELDFTCTIMLLGKTGVGKSATINSIFDEPKTGTNAFMPSTKKVQEIVGHVHGIKVRVIDTPGLLPSVADQRHNEKIMASVKRFIKKSPPDIVLYFDRLDMQSRDYGDLPLLRTITDTFGAAVWFNAIVVLTHASSAPPDGPNGLPLSYEMFVAQRSHVVQQTIRQAAGDMRLMNPVSLVENHPACRVNRARQRVLPNGQVWKPQLLLLCFASKILAEANSLLKLQDNTPGRPFGARPRVPPLPFLLSSLLQSRAQLKLPDEQMGDEDESDEELDEDSDSDEEEDYDQLPPFRRLSREEVAELDEENRKNYFEELAERERLFQKKQWKEELKRRKEMKRRMAESPKGDQTQLADEGADDDMGRSAAVPVPMPDMALPPSFDSDNPSHRYRYLETATQWLVRPVLEAHGWDHDSGYDGFSLEKMFVVGEKIPASVSGQITKDKKEANLTMECAASLKHGEGKVTLAGLDLQTIGKDLAYTLRSETRFSNFKGNKTTGGLAVTLLGDTIAAGMKIEDRLIVGKRLKLVLNGGAITGRGDVAYGGSLEATLRDKDYPLSRTLSTLGLSVMDWHGDLAIGGNLQSQMVLGKTMVVGRANLNNRGAGQISIRASSSEQLQMALIGLLPVIRSLANRLFFSQSQQ
ncbi:hypothetical protein R1sor_026273 [Riccia sorocarpa]|uniref:AIG1-type G domain-containing protein n=1 Tax=Riccia sorocarpa TaxID=122646 RepID=A0ABD3GDZ9_9MARC